MNILKGNASVYWNLQCLLNILRKVSWINISLKEFRTLKLEPQLVTCDQFHTKRTFPVDVDSFNLPIKPIKPIKPLLDADPRGWTDSPWYGRQAGGMHPTGMHTCFSDISHFIIVSNILLIYFVLQLKSKWEVQQIPDITI